MNKWILIFHIIATGYTNEIYKIMHNDNLISIIKNKYSKKKIYGKDGMLKNILLLNPKIKNVNRIYENKNLNLPNSNISIPSSQLSLEESNKKLLIQEQTDQEISPEKKALVISKNFEPTNKWNIKLLYGLKYFYLNQKKTYTDLTYNNLLNILKFETEYVFNNYKFIGSFDNQKFSYSSPISDNSTTLINLKLIAIKNNYLFGISQKGFPLIKTSTNTVNVLNEKQYSLVLGYDMPWQSLIYIPLLFDCNISAIIPITGSSSHSNSLSGIGLDTKLEIVHSILHKEKYSIDIIWQNELNFYKNSRVINSSFINGSIDSSGMDAKSIVGMGIKF